MLAMNTSSDFSSKWSGRIEKAGYIQVPNLLISQQAGLGITSTEMTFILGVLMHKWTEDNPFPSLITIAKYTGKKRNTMQAAARNLCEKGLIKRIERGGNQTNEYDFQPLISRLESYTHPIKKTMPTYRKADNHTYRKFDNEKDALNKTKERRRNGNSGKLTSVGSVLKEKGWL